MGLPHPSAQLVDQDGRIAREWLPALNEIFRRLPTVGTATFVADTSVAVTLPVAQPDTNYTVTINGVDNRTYWVTAKSTTGFTLNASASNSDVVGWAVMRA